MVEGRGSIGNLWPPRLYIASTTFTVVGCGIFLYCWLPYLLDQLRGNVPLPELTPIERSALLVLVAENRPLKEVDLFRTFGIRMKARHRETLKSLGLIETKLRPITHSLTKSGWEWAQAQTEAARPKGTSGQGALYALLSAVGRYARRHGFSLSEIFAEENVPSRFQAEVPLLPSGRTEKQMLQDAELVETDEALALLLQDQPVVSRALSNLSKRAPPELRREVQATKNAINLILQWGNRAAEKRGIAAIGAQGEKVEFDPGLYETEDSVTIGAPAIVRQTAIVRKTSSGPLVLARGKVSTT